MNKGDNVIVTQYSMSFWRGLFWVNKQLIVAVAYHFLQIYLNIDRYEILI